MQAGVSESPAAVREPPPPRAPLRERPVPPVTRARIALVRAFLVAWMRCLGLTGLYRLGRFFGTLEYLVDYNRRRRVQRKLVAHFKDRADPAWRRRMTRRYFMRTRCDKMIYTIMDRVPREKILNRIKLIGRAHIDDALARNRGVYVALCHYGAHHVAGLMMALLGYRLVGVRDPRESAVRRYIQEKYRETFPEVAAMRLLFNDAFPRDLYRAYQSNSIVASLLDVDRPRTSQLRTWPVTIFGETREFLTGPLKAALRCGATVLQGYVVSRENYYYRLIVTTPLIDPERESDEDAIIPGVLQQYATNVEAFASRHPDHLMKI